MGSVCPEISSIPKKRTTKPWDSLTHVNSHAFCRHRYLSICLHQFLSVSLTADVSLLACVFLNLSASFSVGPHQFLSVCLYQSLCLSLCMPACLPNDLSSLQPVYLSVCFLPIYMHLSAFGLNDRMILNSFLLNYDC